MLKIIFGLYAEIMQAFRPTLNRTTADVAIVFIHVRNINVNENVLSFVLEL